MRARFIGVGRGRPDLYTGLCEGVWEMDRHQYVCHWHRLLWHHNTSGKQTVTFVVLNIEVDLVDYG